MKLSKLMLAVAVAATTFAACNKQETTPVVNDNMGNKSIVLSIANVGTPTKGSQGLEDTIGATQVILNDYQVFFADDNGNFYAPKDSTASATNPVQTYFTVTSDGTDQDYTHQFHFLDNNVTRVIVVGNAGEDFAPANEDALWEAYEELAIAEQQDAQNLVLYGSDSDLTTTGNHDNYEDQHPAPVYKAVVNLKPAVARFEVVGYEYAQKAPAADETEAPAREYASVAVNSQSLIGFYETAALTSTGEANWTVTPENMHAFGWDAEEEKCVLYTWDNVYQDYFSQLTNADKAAWYYDAMTDVTLNAAGSYVEALATMAEDGTYEGEAYAYHVFPTAVPSFIFQITATDANGIVTPMYLQTQRFTGVTALEAGKVYQMNVKFDDSVLKAAEKCIDVEITVHEWVVTVVTPEF